MKLDEFNSLFGEMFVLCHTSDMGKVEIKLIKLE